MCLAQEYDEGRIDSLDCILKESLYKTYFIINVVQ